MCAGCDYTVAETKIARAGGLLSDPGMWPRREVYFQKDSNLNDEAFAGLLPALRENSTTTLILFEVPVTDSSIPLMRQIPALTEFGVVRTQITLAGLRQLKGVKLRTIWCDFDEDSIARLRADFPEATVVFWP
jgi:hypothetical protein